MPALTWGELKQSNQDLERLVVGLRRELAEAQNLLALSDESNAALADENDRLRDALAEQEDRHFHERSGLEDECRRLSSQHNLPAVPLMSGSPTAWRSPTGFRAWGDGGPDLTDAASAVLIISFITHLNVINIFRFAFRGIRAVQGMQT